MIFKREPSFWLGLIRSVLALLVALQVAPFNRLTENQTGAILAISAAVLAVGVALAVHPFKWPLITGVVQAGVALAISFGANLSVEAQGSIMTVIGFVVILLDRQTVTPEVSRPADYPSVDTVAPGPKRDAHGRFA